MGHNLHVVGLQEREKRQREKTVNIRVRAGGRDGVEMEGGNIKRGRAGGKMERDKERGGEKECVCVYDAKRERGGE